MRKALRIPLLALALAASAATPAQAQAPLTVGISDQRPETFAEADFGSLGIRHARLIVPWNAVLVNPGQLDGWLAGARAAGVEPLVAFNHADGDRCPAQPCRLPSVGEYRYAISQFRQRYPDVRTIQPWNEANHQSQPTARNPRRAAQFYNAVRQLCGGCTVVAADVLDQRNMERWLATFRRYAPRARLWGLHNYTDANRFRTSGTERLLRAVPGQVWLTETGGIHEFTTTSGQVAFRPDEARAARAIRHAFRIAATYRTRITRLYVYQWRKTNPGDRFDAGIVDLEGRPRQAFYVLRQLLTSGARPFPGRRTPQPPRGGPPPGRGR
jgi:hypothetical protein